jgi:predicted TIM-barrel fold metal-dependent hydrolase
MPLDIQAGIKRPKIDMHCHVFKMDNWEKSSDHLVECGEALGITELWCSSIVGGGKIIPPEEICLHNNTILSAMKRHPKRIRGWCFVIPGHYQAALDEIDRCLDAGMIGIKLYNQYWINDPAVFPVIERAVKRKVPILEHAGYPQPKFKAAQPHISHGIHFTEASQRYPEAMLIHAHIAGGGDWEQTVREMRNASPNVYIDVSGSNLDDGMVEFAVQEMGVERILFGTDGTMAGSVGRVLDADLTEEQRERIFWGNAERILAPQGATPTESRF